MTAEVGGNLTREEVIGELIRLKRQYADTGEDEATLWGHFGYEYDHGEVVWIEDGGKVVAFADFSWVNSPEDVEACYQGIPTKGSILNVINVVCERPGLVWRLRKMLPQARWVTGMRGDRFYVPKGWPLDAQATATA